MGRVVENSRVGINSQKKRVIIYLIIVGKITLKASIEALNEVTKAQFL